MIRWETALRWGRVVRTALKAGTIGLAAAMAVRPDHLGLGYSSLDELLAADWSAARATYREARPRRLGTRADHCRRDPTAVVKAPICPPVSDALIYRRSGGTA